MNTKNNPKRLCLLRLSALGDVTHVLPVINAIRTAWPDCKITWIIGEFEKNLFDELPDVEFISFNKKAGLAGYRQLFFTLRQRQFDVLLHMQLSLRANLIAMMVRAPRKIGFDRSRSKEGHSLVVNERIENVAGQHVLEAFLSFLKPLGLQSQAINYCMPVSTSAVDSLSKLIPGKDPYVVISPASSHALRNWSVEGYAVVADHLIRVHKLRVVLSGGKSELERSLGIAIERQMKEKPLNLIGKDTLGQMVAMLDQTLFLVSPDSGPAHIANALGTPVLGLYAATDCQRSGPYHSRHWCVDAYAKAAQQFLDKQASELKWGKKIELPGVMSLIEIDEVINRTDQMVAELSPGRE
ncbi:MAG: ADP-heptose--LPS heptosyltransferase [Gammaproteobacteria bacterium]|nr:MAG: ADP-heptose--LPS heptosyltransferase [Gammaproteobacteria bacterium]